MGIGGGRGREGEEEVTQGRDVEEWVPVIAEIDRTKSANIL